MGNWENHGQVRRLWQREALNTTFPWQKLQIIESTGHDHWVTSVWGRKGNLKGKRSLRKAQSLPARSRLFKTNSSVRCPKPSTALLWMSHPRDAGSSGRAVIEEGKEGLPWCTRRQDLTLFYNLTVLLTSRSADVHVEEHIYVVCSSPCSLPGMHWALQGTFPCLHADTSQSEQLLTSTMPWDERSQRSFYVILGRTFLHHLQCSSISHTGAWCLAVQEGEQWVGVLWGHRANWAFPHQEPAGWIPSLWL